ncbi:protein with unknown function [Ricinus communis]|uniref:DUF3444 domain-containing protein n=1 Tax=Ricinus communis TaxID=3988 RepID=B9RSY4_RICCO|nr:protein with unknown function [Ricinus communis]
MPRFYARITKVFFPEFTLQITWLEPDPDANDETEWVQAGLLVSCGKFKNGNFENAEGRLMFSHMIEWEKGSQRDAYKIFPSKVKGFVSLFCHIRKEGKDTFLIPPTELFRFSHMIPLFKFTGAERGVPKGSFKLDPASLPKDIEEIPKDYVLEDGNYHPNEFEVINVSEGCSIPPASIGEAIEISEPEFSFSMLRNPLKSFRTSRGASPIYTDSNCFSHQLSAEPAMNFKCSIQGKINCYSGCRSIVTADVLYTELLRFSHQIPIFQLTDQKDGSLRGFWEFVPEVKWLAGSNARAGSGNSANESALKLLLGSCIWWRMLPLEKEETVG